MYDPSDSIESNNIIDDNGNYYTTYYNTQTSITENTLEENPEYYNDASQPPFRFVHRQLSDEVLQLFIDGMIRVPANSGIPRAGFKWYGSYKR